MTTNISPITPASLQRAGRIIRDGGLVGFPTETVYGLGADALNGEAVRRIFEAKGRPGDNPLIVHIPDTSWLSALVEGPINPRAKALMDAYWPGPMTLILPRGPVIPDEVTAGLDTVGIRLPAHPAARALIAESGRPIAAPSANRSGRPSPTTARHVFDDMSGRIPLILDGGACEVGVESTVIDVSGPEPRVLRPGGVTPEMIEAVCGTVEVDEAVMRPLKEGEKPRSPGMKYRHYAPKGEVVIFEGEADRVARKIIHRYDNTAAKAAILALPGHENLYGSRHVIPLGAGDSAAQVAAGLFAALRQLDDEGIEAVYSEAINPRGVGLAVMNRLGRAAGFRIEKV